jgi:predicted oxidoreductase (fatty acid repression mutant protein)
MKRLLYLLLGIIIITYACQTNTELTDADKDAIVQAVKQVSQELQSIMSSTYDSETYSKIIKFCDENSDRMWQAEPVAAIFNLDIISKQADNFANYESWFENRISGVDNVQKAHYSVLSDNKVLEVLEGDFSINMKDSTELGPFTWVGTNIWANIEGEWKMQFSHNSFAPQSE